MVSRLMFNNTFVGYCKYFLFQFEPYNDEMTILDLPVLIITIKYDHCVVMRLASIIT